MFYYSALLLWPQQIAQFFTTDITYAGWLSVSQAPVATAVVVRIKWRLFKSTC